MPLDEDMLKYTKREPLIDDTTRTLTEAGKKYLDERFKEWIKTPKKALRKYHQLDPIAQEYLRRKYHIHLLEM